MQIKLDRVALRHLIEKDPAFELDLQKAVLSEVVRNLFQKDIGRILESDKGVLAEILRSVKDDGEIMRAISQQVEARLTVKEDPSWWASKTELRPEVQATVDGAVDTMVYSVKAKLLAAVREAFEPIWEEKAAGMNAEIQRRVDAKFNTTMEATINLRVTQRLAQIAQGIANT